MMRSSPKYLGAATLLALAIISGGCRNSILHKEGASEVAREAVEPITRSLDDQTDKLIEELQLDELTYELRELVKTTRGLVNNLEETRGETTALIKTARELVENINSLTPEVTILLSNINDLVEEVKKDATAGVSETTPLWMKTLPYIIYGIGGLVVLLILGLIIKKVKQ